MTTTSFQCGLALDKVSANQMVTALHSPLLPGLGGQAHLSGLGLPCASRALGCTAQVQVDGTHECTVAPAQQEEN